MVVALWEGQAFSGGSVTDSAECLRLGLRYSEWL